MSCQADYNKPNKEVPYRIYRDNGKVIISIKSSNIETLLKNKEFEFETGKTLIVRFQEVKEITPDVLNLLKSCNKYLFEADEMVFTYCEFKDFNSVDEIFMYFENVKELELSEVTISNLKDSTKELSCLNSSTNTLTIANSDIEISLSNLRNFKSLEHLRYYKALYSSEETQHINTNSDVYFNRLKTVEIYNIDADKFFKDCTILDSVDTLKIKDCNTKSISEILFKFKNLKNLELVRVVCNTLPSSKKIENLPLPILKSLFIGRCILPDTIFNFENLPELEDLLIYKTSVKGLDLSKNKKLIALNLQNLKGLNNLNLEFNTHLKKLIINECRDLYDLNLTNNLELEGLQIKLVNLKQLQISHLNALKILEVNYTDITDIVIPTGLIMSYEKECFDPLESRSIDLRNNRKLKTFKATVKYTL